MYRLALALRNWLEYFSGDFAPWCMDNNDEHYAMDLNFAAGFYGHLDVWQA